MRMLLPILMTMFVLSGCENGVLGRTPWLEIPPEGSIVPESGSMLPTPGDEAQNAVGETTSEEIAGVLRPASGSTQLLGTTIASLGAAGEPGLWLKTPLVSGASMGRVETVETGQALQLELRPLDRPQGSGSQISLSAMRQLNLPLTSLPELRVYSF